MATSYDVEICANKNCKNVVKNLCIGCRKYFCSLHFSQHEQALGAQFHNEIVQFHNELLDQMQNLETDITSSSELFAQIEQWKTRTIQAVENAAQAARQRLTNLINKDRTTVQNKMQSISAEIRNNKDDKILEKDIERFKLKLQNIKGLLNKVTKKDTKNSIIMKIDQIDWNRIIYIQEERVLINLSGDATWEQLGTTVAGGNGMGGNYNQLDHPLGLFVDDDDDKTMAVADQGNHRIIQWKRGETSGQVVAGGNGQGNRPNQLNVPSDVLIDKETNSLIITDHNNRRVVRWSRRRGTTQGEVLIDKIDCYGLVMDDQRYLYVSDFEKHEVKRFEIDRGDTKGTIVAGGNGKGNGFNQLNSPRYLFVDRNQSLYVSDYMNHRVMKWDKGATIGIVVAGGQGAGTALTQLFSPRGLFVDTLGTLYVAEWGNHRVTRWHRGSKQGHIVVGGRGKGAGADQFSGPRGLCFDKHGNLYVVDNNNHRVQRFNLII